MNQSENSQAFLGLTAEVISAHVKNNHVDAADLPFLIEQVYLALRHAGGPAALAQALPDAALETERQTPVVPIKKSVFPDYIICLEDGRKMKTLKRYLRTTYNMTPEQYREKWGLAAEYPMVAPSYAEHRSVLAKQTGLGRKPATPPAVAVVPAAAEIPDELAPAPAPAPVPPPRIQAVIEPPVRERRGDHTLASVFSNFPQAADAPSDSPDDQGDGDDRKPRRKPFSKQLARTMRR